MNTGIFITKSGVTLPVVTDIASSTWNSYANDRVLPMLQSTNHLCNAFEAFRFRVFVDADDLLTDATVHALFNTTDNRALSFSQGAGSSPQVAGITTISSSPAQFEAANRFFLQGSNLIVEHDADMGLGIRVASIDNESHIMFDFGTGDITVTNQGVESDTDTYATGAANDENEIEIREDAIEFKDNTSPASIYSFARQYKITRTAGTSIQIDGGAGGTWTNFNVQETIAAQAITGNSTIEVESNFGQVTEYTVKVGVALDASDTPEDFQVTFAAGSAGNHDVKDNFTGGVGNKTYTVISGSLPTGMSLTSNGIVQGTPATDGVFTATIRVQDEYGNQINLEYTFTVTESANVAFNPPNGIVGIAYNYLPNITDVESVTLSSGVLPTGLSLDGDNGNLTGTPSVAGTYGFAVDILLASELTETVDVEVVIYPTMLVALEVDSVEVEATVDNLGSYEVNQNDSVKLNVTGGSGQFQYAISGDNIISTNGQIDLYQSGEVTVTVVDLITGQSLTFTLLVAGQAAICGYAVEEEGGDVSENAPCVDIITDCNTPVNIAFNAMHILRNIEVGETPYREYPVFENLEGSEVQNSGKAFAMWRSTADNGWGVANNPKNGKAFLLEFAVNSTVANGTADVAVGITKKDSAINLAQLNYAVVITTVNDERVVEIRRDNSYQNGSRFAIAEGQQVGFAVYPSAVLLYIDGILKYTLASQTLSCSGMNLAFFAEKANMILGGKATNLLYSIETSGTLEQVGTIDPQTGLYSPSLTNVGFVRITATSTVNDEVAYLAKVRVIRPAAKASFERAMLEGVPVDLWIADVGRADDLPLRLDRQGRPDANQISNPRHLGVLQGSARIEAAMTRNEFRNDIGATSSAMTIDKVTVTGAFLNVRDLSTVKELVPYMREFSGHGVRQLKQFSTGCHKRKRLLMIWQSPDCEDVPVYDAIEVYSAFSYTPFNLEVGKSVQSNIPISIEGFPTSDGLLFDFNQYDKHFHRIGG